MPAFKSIYASHKANGLHRVVSAGKGFGFLDDADGDEPAASDGADSGDVVPRVALPAMKTAAAAAAAAKADKAEKDVEEAQIDALEKELREVLGQKDAAPAGETKEARNARYRAKLDDLRAKVAAATPAAPSGGAGRASGDGTPSFGEVLRQRVGGAQPAAAPAAAAGAGPAEPRGGDAQQLTRILLRALQGESDLAAEGEDQEAVSGTTGLKSKVTIYRRLAQKRPGLLTERELRQMASQLEPNASDVRSTTAPMVLQFLTRIFLPLHPIRQVGTARYREMRTLAEGMDKLLAGDVGGACDIFMCRFKSLQQQAIDGNDSVARWFELIPHRDTGMSLSVEDEELTHDLEAREAKRRRLLVDRG